MRFSRVIGGTVCTRVVLGMVAIVGASVIAQSPESSYRLVEKWPELPTSMNGGEWGETIGVDRDPDGNMWVLHRCFNTEPRGAATCVGRDDSPPILKFNPEGRLLDSWGEGRFAFPHGFHIDPSGNLWATDANGSDTVLGMSAGGRGHQVFQFSPTGALLLTLGKAGVAGNGTDTFDRPTDVAVSSSGDVFVTDGHGPNNRVVKFSKEGRFLKTWGHTGDGPGEFNQPHTIAIDSQDRVYVGDRSNGRVQVFDAEGIFLRSWSQFGRPSGMFIDEHDVLYVTDSTSNSRNNAGWKRGIYIGSVSDGIVTAFIPDPDLARQDEQGISGASGVSTDAQGNVYAADVGPRQVRKYLTP